MSDREIKVGIWQVKTILPVLRCQIFFDPLQFILKGRKLIFPIYAEIIVLPYKCPENIFPKTTNFRVIKWLTI